METGKAIQEFVDQKLRHGKQEILAGEEPIPQCYLFVHYIGGLAKIPLPHTYKFFDQDLSAKRGLRGYVEHSWGIVKSQGKIQAFDPKLLAVIMTAEMFITKHPIVNNDLEESIRQAGRTSSSPDRQDAMAVYVHTPAGCVQHALYYFRTKTAISFDEHPIVWEMPPDRPGFALQSLWPPNA